MPTRLLFVLVLAATPVLAPVSVAAQTCPLAGPHTGPENCPAGSVYDAADGTCVVARG